MLPGQTAVKQRSWAWFGNSPFCASSYTPEDEQIFHLSSSQLFLYFLKKKKNTKIDSILFCKSHLNMSALSLFCTKLCVCLCVCLGRLVARAAFGSALHSRAVRRRSVRTKQTDNDSGERPTRTNQSECRGRGS